MGACKGTVHARCCHRLATSATFTAKAAAWPTAHGKRRWAPQTTRDATKGIQQPNINENVPHYSIWVVRAPFRTICFAIAFGSFVHLYFFRVRSVWRLMRCLPDTEFIHTCCLFYHGMGAVVRPRRPPWTIVPKLTKKQQTTHAQLMSPTYWFRCITLYCVNR